MKDNHTAQEERRFAITLSVSFSRSYSHRLQAGSSVDLIGPDRKLEHRDAFTNQCHHETRTHRYTQTHTRRQPTYSNPVRVCVCVSSGKIFAALGFAAWCYQSCQAGRSAAQENVAGVESRHTFRVSLCVCVLLRYNKELFKRMLCIFSAIAFENRFCLCPCN